MNTYKITTPSGSIKYIQGESIRGNDTTQQMVIINFSANGHDIIVAIVPNNCLIEVL